MNGMTTLRQEFINEKKFDLEVSVTLELQPTWLLGEEYFGIQNYEFVTWRWNGNERAKYYLTCCYITVVCGDFAAQVIDFHTFKVDTDMTS
jgi:hypothetical protein